jgi:hypothetical protein
MSKLDNSNLFKILTLTEMVDILFPDPPLAVTTIRTAITKKQSANDINLNRTKTSQEARKVEDQLAIDLKKEYKKIMNDDTKEFGVLQRRYGPEVEKIIRGAVQKLYLIGADYATKTQDTTAFITTKDLDNIKNQVKSGTDAFWRRIYNAIHKKEFTIIPKVHLAASSVSSIDDEEPPLPDPELETTALATILATMTLALSTLSKLDQLPSEENIKRALVWVTEGDAVVCPICSALQGQEWDEGDPDMPLPGPEPEGGTHHNCRCRLMIKMGEDILSG